MRNRAYIDLKAIRGNAAAIRKKLPEGVKLCAVVKADGYGHGAVRTARALYGLADCLAVALPEEGRELRFAGEAREILVLTPLQPGDEAVAVRHGLTASVSRAEEICSLQAASARKSAIFPPCFPLSRPPRSSVRRAFFHTSPRRRTKPSPRCSGSGSTA